MRVGILGAGRMGRGLARCLALAGDDVFLGSRDAAKAQELATSINREAGIERVRPASYAEAAAQGEVVILAVPYREAATTLTAHRDALQGKVVVDITNPLGQTPTGVVTPPGSSGLEENQRAAGPGIRLVGAFRNNFADTLGQPDFAGPRADCWVFGDDAAAKQVVLDLARRCGFDAVDVGPAAAARQVEQTVVLIIAVRRSLGRRCAFKLLVE